MAQRLALRLFLASVAAAELMADYLGMRLGLYESLARDGSATAEELAQRAGIATRYAREWLEQQSASGILAVDSVDKEPHERVYALPVGHADVFTNLDSPYSIAPFAVLPAAGIARTLPLLLEAYRTGRGVPGDRYDEDWQAGQASFNRATFRNQLPGWLRDGLPDIHARLSSGGRVADVACGTGWSTLAIAQTYE
ncbi:MAG TPA: hypothetical protein VNY84_08075, partial [Acidimicrobiales bacterium]|nr:hypothetical protein [Acidimicrobiales bacterium]